MSDWSKEGINERLRVLVSTKSFVEVAVILNKEYGTSFSRNATIGRATRMGIRQPVAPKKPKAPRKRHRQGGQRDSGLAARIISRPKPEAIPVIIDNEIPLEQRKTLLELTHWTCRWPVGHGANVFFCGAIPVDGKPYCASHAARAYQKTTYELKTFVDRRRVG